MRGIRSVAAAPEPIRIGGCTGCAGSGWEGYRVVYLLEQATETRPAPWEWRRCPLRCTQASRAETIRHGLAVRAAEQAAAEQAGTVPDTNEHQEVRHVASHQESAKVPTTRRPAAGGRPQVRAARPQVERVAAVAVDVVDGVLVVDVDSVPAPGGAATLAGLFGWIGAGLPLGVERAHRDGRDTDGTVCLSAAACSALKLPAKLPTTPAAAARFDAKMRKAATAAGLELSGEIGTGFKAFRRRGAGGPKVSVKVLITPWLGQGDVAAQKSGQLVTALATTADGGTDAATLARRLRAFVADMGVAPGATAAVTGMNLLDALRPRFTWTQGADGRWVSAPREGALPDGDCAVPPAAGGRHPLTLVELNARRPLCEEEDFKAWARPLTDAEAAEPWAVAVDVCASFLSVTETLRLPSGRSPWWTPPSGTRSARDCGCATSRPSRWTTCSPTRPRSRGRRRRGPAGTPHPRWPTW
jgi:hypothetical protein